MIVQDHPEKSPGASQKPINCPPHRTQGRFLRRGWFWAACLGLVLLAGNLLSNVPVAHASSLTHHNGVPASSQPPAVSGPRVSPNLNPQPLSVGTWHAQQVTSATTDTAPFAENPQGRKPGEQPDLRTATSDTYLNANGTWTLKSYGSPINYKDGDGHWQPIDSTLIGDTSITGYAYGNKSDDWHVHFARQAGGPNLVHVKLPSLTMQETLQGAASVKGQVSGSQMEYAEVFPGTALLYNVSSSNLEELLLLQNAQGPDSYTFVYHLPGASAHQDADGNVIFTDAKGTILLTVGGVFMYESDAHGQMSPQGLGSQSIQISLASQGADFLVTLTPDQTWLKDPKRHFPVAIDPSQTWSGTNSGGNTTNGNVYASANNESAYPDNGYGNDQLGMRIGNCNATQGTGVSRAYLKFPVGSAPAGVRVTSADLAVYQTSMYGGGLGVAVNAEVMPVAWNATTLTWNNRPTGGITVGSANTASTQLTWVHWNVSAAVAQWWQGGMALNGLSLRYANESQQCQFFESDNASSNRPVLTINYVQDTTQPTGSVSFNSGATSTNNLSVSVAPSALDPGSIDEWNSNWTTVNGVGTQHVASNWSVDSSHSQLNADTSPCGSSSCWVQTLFTHSVNVNNWPTFTAAFKTDTTSNFEVGIIDSGNNATRCMLHGGNGAFVSYSASYSAGSYSWNTINIPFSANTWYFGQFALTATHACIITVWQVGQARPSTPSVVDWITTIPNPSLVFQHNGDDGANLHHYTIGNVTMTSRDTNSSTVGTGVSMMSLSSDNSTWGCPSYSGGSSFANGPWCVYSNQSFPFTLSGTDGKKAIYYQYTDNVGRTLTGSGSIIYDTKPPVVNSLTPGNDSEVRGIVTVQVNATDPAASDGSSSGVASAVLYVDGAQVGSPVSGTSKPTFLWDTTDLAPGVHTLTAKATDAAGNTGVIGGSTTVIVDNTSGTSSAIVGGVNLANGDAIVSATDLNIPGLGPDLSITRTYHSLSNEIGFFGHNWSSNLDEALSFPGDGSAVYIDASGGYHVFLPNGSGGYLTSPGLYLTLVKNSDGTYTITARDQSKTNFSSAGQLGSIVDRHGNTLTVNYGSNGFPSTVTDASGRQLTITSSNDEITQITDPAGNVYKYRYNAGYLEDYINPQGIETAYNLHSIPGMLTSFTVNYTSAFPVGDAQTNVTTKLTYDSKNRLVKLVDPMGYDTDLAYSTVGDASQTVVKHLQGISPATYASATFLMTTDGMGSVAKETDALGNVTQAQYDANGNVTQATDADGHVATSTYDANGNVLTQTADPGSSPHLNLKTSYTYDSDNNVLTKTDPAGIVTQYTYDSPTAGDVIKTIADYVSGGATNSDTNVTTSATYDSYGEILTATDPTGVVTQNTYDQYGDVLTTIANYKSGVTPDFQTNVTTSATYDVLGERLTATNSLGIVTQYTYDNLGYVIQTVANYQSGQPSTAQVNVTAKTGYDALGRPVTTTSPRGLVTKTVYDDDGRVTQTILDYVNGGPSDTQTNVIASTQTYDAMGDVLTATDAKGNVTTTAYDLDGRTLKITQADSSGTVLSNGQVVYDAAGLVVERDMLDASGNLLLKLIYGYDGVGRNTTTTIPAALPGMQGQAGTPTVSTVTYNADGEQAQVKVTNAGLPSPGIVEEATATYDHLGRVLTKTEEANTSSSQTSSFVYDLDGRQTSTTDPAGKVTSTIYGALGKVLSTTQPDSTVTTMTYDAAGELLSRSNSAGTTKDTYGPLGRVTYEERDNGNGALQTGVTYTYDADSNKLTQQTNYGGGTNTTYTWTYDKLDRAATMSDGTRTYTYDLNSNVTQMAVAVGGNTITQDTYTYDGKNRLTGLQTTVTTSGTTLHTYGYAYDALGNQKQITADGTTTTYSYDNLNQLVDVKQGSTTVASYNYDANSNRVSMTTSAGTTSYSYDSSDTMLTSKTDPNGKVTNYTYDKNGNLTQEDYDPSISKQLTGFTYDAENRLTKVTEPGGMTIQFAYDADGHRISKTVTSGSTVTTVKYVYTLGHLAEETDGSGIALASFTYEESGRPASVVLGNPSTGSRYYYVYNGHGDVVALTDASGTVVASYTYDAFGAITSSSENFPNGWSNPYRYDGADGVLYDGETGLYWMSVRAYDPTLGRFLQHDPVFLSLSKGLRSYLVAAFSPYIEPTESIFHDSYPDSY